MTNCSYANVSQLMSTICSPFPSRPFMSDFFLVPIVFCQFFTCIVSCGVDLRVLLIFVPKVSGDDCGVTRDDVIISIISNKCVTTQNLAFLCYLYRKKHLQMHF